MPAKVEMKTADYMPQLDLLTSHFPNAHLLCLYHALAKGYFRDNGLYLAVGRTQHSPKVVEGLLHGIFPVGNATAAEVIQAAAKHAAAGGKAADFPLRIIYQYGQNYATAYYSLSNDYRRSLGLAPFPREVRAPENLIGKVVRVGSGTPTHVFWLLAHKAGLKDRVNPSVEKNGVDPRKINLSWVEEFDVKTYSNLLLQGRLDVYSKPVFGHGQFLGRAKTTNKGLSYVSFSTRDWGVPDIYGMGMVARKDFLDEHPDMALAFVKALHRAMPECVRDTRVGVREMNRIRGFGEDYDAIEGIKSDIVAGKHPEITGPGGFYGGADVERHGYGCIREEKLQQLIDLMDEAGTLPARISLAGLYQDLLAPRP